MRPVNLIPPEERRGESIPLRAGVASYVVVGVLAVALVAVVAIVLTGNSINEKKAELGSLQARQAAAQQRASELSAYTTFASESQDRQLAVQSLAKSRFDWHRVLREIALVTPHDVWLESMSGSVSPAVSVEGSEASPDTTIVGPSLHIVGCGRSQDSVAGFLAAMNDIDGVTRVGIDSSTLGEPTSPTDNAAAAAGAGDSQDTDCQTRPSVAKFDVTVAFDAVPASAFSPTSPSTIPVATTTGTSTTTDGTATTPATGTATTPTTSTPAAGTATTPSTTSSDGVSDGAAEDQAGKDSAAKQIDKAKSGASNVGVGQ